MPDAPSPRARRAWWSYMDDEPLRCDPPAVEETPAVTPTGLVDMHGRPLMRHRERVGFSIPKRSAPDA